MAETSLRVGIGYDVHGFAPEGTDRPFIVGGIRVPYTRGLQGYSDADVLIHAVVDALLGAAVLGDIGTHFPSSDERWRDAPSTRFLEYAMELLRERGWRVVNVDATVVAERPRLTPHVPAMRERLADIMGIDVNVISVKAKTTDGLGFTGRSEGVACHAVALIERTGAA